MPIPTTMRIALTEEAGVPASIVTQPVPAVLAGEVLVRIEASGVNPLDLKIFSGKAPHARHPFPAVLGLDLAGSVEALGAGVHHLQEGDAVFGMTGGVGGIQGSLAEYAVVDARLLALRPPNLTAREAAVLPLVVITAWEGLIDQAKVNSGDNVLIHGGGGGVGSAAVQIALAQGARVYATGSATNRQYIENLGAMFIDYHHEPVADYVARLTGNVGFDVVYDTVGGGTLDASFVAVRRGGHVVSALGWGTHSLAPLSMRAATYSGVFTLLPLLTGEGRAHHGEILTQAATLITEGKLTPRLDPREFNLSTVAQAYGALSHVTARGKLAITISNCPNPRHPARLPMSTPATLQRFAPRRK